MSLAVGFARGLVDVRRPGRGTRIILDEGEMVQVAADGRPGYGHLCIGCYRSVARRIKLMRAQIPWRAALLSGTNSDEVALTANGEVPKSVPQRRSAFGRRRRWCHAWVYGRVQVFVMGTDQHHGE